VLSADVVRAACSCWPLPSLSERGGWRFFVKVNSENWQNKLNKAKAFHRLLAGCSQFDNCMAVQM